MAASLKMFSGGMTLVKYLLFIFNLLFVISGIAILVIGILALYPYKEYASFMDAKFSAGPIILIAVGSVIFIIAFFGSFGAIKENICMIVTYSVLLLTIFCIQLAAGICGYLYRSEVKRGVEKLFWESMDKYHDDPEIRSSWDVVQKDLQCCGVSGPGDWTRRGIAIPVSCCETPESDGSCRNVSIFSRGCSSVLKDELEHFALIMGGVAISLAFVQVLGVILAGWLGWSIRKKHETVEVIF